MKKQIATILVCFILLGISAYSQNKIYFSYDNSGNRIKRELYIPEAQRSRYLPDSFFDPIKEQIDSVSIAITPDRNSRTINVRFTGAKDIKGNYHIYDSGGRIIVRSGEASDEFLIDVETLPKGVYILHLSIGEQIRTRKIRKD